MAYAKRGSKSGGRKAANNAAPRNGAATHWSQTEAKNRRKPDREASIRPRLWKTERIVLREGAAQPGGLFTIFRVRQAIARRAGVPTEFIDAGTMAGILVPDYAQLVRTGAVEVMTGVDEEERVGPSSYPNVKFGHANTQGRLSLAEYERFRPKPRNARYPVVYRVTKFGRRLVQELEAG